MKFNPIKKELLFAKNDPEDIRWGERVSTSDDVAGRAVLWGYPDDEGIKLNGGRPGSALAPDTIRKYFYKMTPSLNGTSPLLVDRGNIDVQASSLKERHDFAQSEMQNHLKSASKVVTLGGGHDYGFSDAAGFVEHTLSLGQRPFIINFDAHLDVRPTVKGHHSGTPFFRLLEKYSKDIDFFEFGIQDWCNSKNHLQWALDHGATVITLDEILSSSISMAELLHTRILSKLKKQNALGLSLDIDALESSASPGASQVFPVGLHSPSLLSAWTSMCRRHKPLWMGVYEVSPPFDFEDQTSKMAALFVHQFLSH